MRLASTTIIGSICCEASHLYLNVEFREWSIKNLVLEFSSLSHQVVSGSRKLSLHNDYIVLRRIQLLRLRVPRSYSNPNHHELENRPVLYRNIYNSENNRVFVFVPSSPRNHVGNSASMPIKSFMNRLSLKSSPCLLKLIGRALTIGKILKPS